MELLFYKTELPVVIRMVSPWIRNDFQSDFPLHSFTVQYNEEHDVYIASDNGIAYNLLQQAYQLDLYQLEIIELLNQNYNIKINVVDNNLIKIINSNNYKKELEDFELAMYMLYDEISHF